MAARAGFGKRRMLAFGVTGLAAGCAVTPFAAPPAEGPAALVPLAGLVHFGFGVPGVAYATGLGFAVAPRTVVTSGHVVRLFGAGSVGDTLPGALLHGAATFTVLAALERPDVAVLRSPHPLQPLRLSTRRARRGERVWMLGAPALGRPVADGVVTIATVRGARGDMFSVRAAGTFGYSGGPTVNALGEVLGMTTALNGPTLQAFASVALVGIDLPALFRADDRELLVQHMDGVRAVADRFSA